MVDRENTALELYIYIWLLRQIWSI